MPSSELPQKIFRLKYFQDQLTYITTKSVSAQFARLDLAPIPDIKVDKNYLLLCGSILAQSEDPNCQDASLRIAQFILSSEDSTREERIAAAVILDTLTNKPAIQLAVDRDLLRGDYETSIPLTLLMDQTRRVMEYSIFTGSNQQIFLNKFQKEFYVSAQTADRLSASAPTSAGKSFILSLLVVESLRKVPSQKIVYLVPTRALINQVEQDFLGLLKVEKMKDVYVASIPQVPTGKYVDLPALYIFTQERLHWFMSENPAYLFDYLIIDEAQKIGDKARGILLQQKIEEVASKNPNVKILYCSAGTSNPEHLLEDTPGDKSKKIVATDYVAVNQNLIWVSSINGVPARWRADLVLQDRSIPLGEFRLRTSLSDIKQLANIGFILQTVGGGSLIYVNGAAFAERAASTLYELIQEETNDAEVEALVDLVKDIIHPQYVLAKVLKKRIGFHYGNMPLIVAKEVERLFSLGKLNFLVCTSTLLEGVNLPARNIFIHNPHRGRRIPMTESDFWNLAGRAGRLRKEFQGNIICIQPNEWEHPPLREKKKQSIRKAIHEISDSRKDQLLDFIRKDTPRDVANREPELEYAFGYYFSKFITGGRLKEDFLTADYLQELELECERIRKIVEIPDRIILRNPGVSPLAQQSLLSYFRGYTGDEENLVPNLPQTDPVGRFVQVIGRISQFLSGDPPELTVPHAILVVNWLRGFPLGRIISANYRVRSRNSSVKIDTVIRDTMNDIEQYVRFSFAKYSSCYVDVLKYFFDTERPSLLQKVPDLSMWVEFGVSKQTEMSLILLGASRHSALNLSQFIEDKEMDTDRCKAWLLETDISRLNLPVLVKAELEGIIRRIKEFS